MREHGREDANDSGSCRSQRNGFPALRRLTNTTRSLRDRFEPGKPLWITETADAACGGNPWASTFLDTFRYLVEHASLARRGVKVIMHNTLAASDYGLLDQNTFEPRPNYWASVLWHKLMGTTVLDPQFLPRPNTYVYAQCLEGRHGGVTLLVINADRQRSLISEFAHSRRALHAHCKTTRRHHS